MPRDDGGNEEGDDDEADGGQKTTSRFLKAVRERKSSFDSTEADPRPAQQGERPPTAEGQFLVRDLTDKRTSEVNWEFPCMGITP